VEGLDGQSRRFPPVVLRAEFFHNDYVARKQRKAIIAG
jgi:hypothetical protein